MTLSVAAEIDLDYTKPEYNKRFTEGITLRPSEPGLRLIVEPDEDLLSVQQKVRELIKNKQLPKGGIEILVKGSRTIHKTLKLTAADSGTQESPIVWRGTSGTILTSGRSLPASKFVKLTDPETLAQCHPAARGKILAMPDVASFRSKRRNGFLSMDHHMLKLACWPNQGYSHIDKIHDGGHTTRWAKPGEKPKPYSKEAPTGGRFTIREPLPELLGKELLTNDRVRIEGYLHNDWYFQNEPVNSIKDGAIQLLRHTRYGVADKIKSLPRRIRITNALALLDEPGEWYYNSSTKTLYVWPIEGFDPEKSTVSIPHGPPLVQMKNTQFLTLRDFHIEDTGKAAIKIQGGHHNLVAGCHFLNGAGRGVEISGGHHNGIAGCNFENLQQAFSLSGGDIQSLTRCYNFAINNNIERCRTRGYGVIGLKGVGIYFAHNRLHDMNGAVKFETIDLLCEFNEFYNIGYEMGDFNVAYCGALWHTIGNVLRYNFVHHLMAPGGHPVCAFRNDDGGAGLHMFGNVFYRSGRCAAQFHGPDNSLDNNIALDVTHLWWTLKKPTTKAAIQKKWRNLERFGKDLPKGSKGDFYYRLEKMLPNKAWEREPWISQYPSLTLFLNTNPWAQTLGSVSNNYSTALRKPFHIHGSNGTVQGLESKEEALLADLPKTGTFELPVAIELSDFVSVEKLDFRFKEGFSPMQNFQPIPFEQIGLRKSNFRPSPPKKDVYRGALYERYKKDRHRKYDPEIVNSRYPKAKYLTP